MFTSFVSGLVFYGGIVVVAQVVGVTRKLIR